MRHRRISRPDFVPKWKLDGIQLGRKPNELLKAPQTHLSCENNVMGWSHDLLFQQQEGKIREISAVCGDI